MAKRSSVYIHGDKLEALKEKGYESFNAIVNKTIDILLSEEFEDLAVEMKKNKIIEMIDEVNRDLVALKLREQSLMAERERLTRWRDTIQEEWDYTKNTVILSGYIKNLGRVIIACDYNEINVREAAQHLLDNITTLNPQFDLAKHIARLKDIMS